MTPQLEPSEPSLPIDFKPDVKKARSLAGKAIHNPTNIKAEEILALAFTVIGMLDAKEPARTAGQPIT